MVGRYQLLCRLKVIRLSLDDEDRTVQRVDGGRSVPVEQRAVGADGEPPGCGDRRVIADACDPGTIVDELFVVAGAQACVQFGTPRRPIGSLLRARSRLIALRSVKQDLHNREMPAPSGDE